MTLGTQTSDIQVQKRWNKAAVSILTAVKLSTSKLCWQTVHN